VHDRRDILAHGSFVENCEPVTLEEVCWPFVLHMKTELLENLHVASFPDGVQTKRPAIAAPSRVFQVTDQGSRDTTPPKSRGNPSRRNVGTAAARFLSAAAVGRYTCRRVAVARQSTSAAPDSSSGVASRTVIVLIRLLAQSDSMPHVAVQRAASASAAATRARGG
jgi:hypothetical protein